MGHDFNALHLHKHQYPLKYKSQHSIAKTSRAPTLFAFELRSFSCLSAFRKSLFLSMLRGWVTVRVLRIFIGAVTDDYNSRHNIITTN